MISGSIFKMKQALPEHLRVPWGGRDALAVFALTWIGTQVAMVLLLLALRPLVPGAGALVQGLVRGEVWASVVIAFVDALAGLVLVWLFLRKYHAGWREVGWRGFNVGRAIGYLASALGLFLVGVGVLLWLVSVLVPSFNPNQPQANDLTAGIGVHPALVFLALVLVPPVIEETVFRGFIFPALSKRWGMVWGAVGSSLLFGFAHLQLNISIYTFILGLFLCFMYVRLKSIIPGMFLHMLNNCLAFWGLMQK